MKFSQANIFYLSHAKSQTVLPVLCKHLIQISLLKYINHFYNFNAKHQPYSFMFSIKISRKGDPEALNVCSLVNSALLQSPHNKASLWIYLIFLGMWHWLRRLKVFLFCSVLFCWNLDLHVPTHTKSNEQIQSYNICVLHAIKWQDTFIWYFLTNADKLKWLRNPLIDSLSWIHN